MPRVNLPDFPWDTIAEDIALAKSFPGGACDLSVGTPVDPTPEIGQRRFGEASNAHGYPTVWGTVALHEAIINYMTMRWSARDLGERNVAPAIGTKELVAWLPTLLGLGPDDTVVVPTIAYPTYEVGAAMVGARVIKASHPGELAGEKPALIWTNSPSNPTGRIDSADETRAWIQYARDVGAILAADECYGEFGWQGEVHSIMDHRLNSGSVEGLLGVYSLSKRSNCAGYRAGFMVGDDTLVMTLVGLRKHLGMMMPTPVQVAMVALLGDQSHVENQREIYLARRTQLSQGLTHAGFTIDDSEGGLYLWATRGEPGRVTAHWFATQGIIVAPGDFYGTAGENHVRIALTATNRDIAEAVSRLA
ncbi:MAG: succinyldiaminopimelate transaminase [Propionibacteriaceae bacterium]|nr:succinyldiaminopimelate transaminase [Propionibacteriaceae bacterium]